MEKLVKTREPCTVSYGPAAVRGPAVPLVCPVLSPWSWTFHKVQLIRSSFLPGVPSCLVTHRPRSPVMGSPPAHPSISKTELTCILFAIPLSSFRAHHPWAGLSPHFPNRSPCLQPGSLLPVFCRRATESGCPRAECRPLTCAKDSSFGPRLPPNAGSWASSHIGLWFQQTLSSLAF